jgi:hypothetical protein
MKIKYFLKKIVYKLKYKIKNIYVVICLWAEFIKSINMSKKPILIFNYETWHYHTDYKYRKKKYKEFLNSKGYNVICIDLKSHIMVFILNLILNNFRFDFNKKLTKNFYTHKFSSAFKYGYWDILVTQKNFININKHIAFERQKYKKFFSHSTNKPSNSNHWRRIYSIFNSKKLKVQGLVLTQTSYEELPLARFALDNKLKIIYFESFLGIQVINPTSRSLMDINRKGFNKIIKTLSETDLKKQITILNQRIKGIEKKTDRNYLLKDITNKRKPVKNYFSFKRKGGVTLCLYLHGFYDSANAGRDTHNYSSFIDFYDFSLYIIEYCAKNNVSMIIKPHPGSINYSKDKYYLKALADVVFKYKLSHNLAAEWVGNDFVNFYLTKISNPVVVTARGTIVSECGYLGVPSISFCNNPWRDLRNLSISVKSITHFEKIFPKIYKSYNSRLSMKEGIIMSAALEKGYQNQAMKIGPGSLTISERKGIESSWELRQEI